MIHIVIFGHGEFAAGLLSGAKLLCGESPACDAINFSEGMSPETLREQLRVSVSDKDEPVLFLTDILGGTPFRECAALATELPQAEVISGANLQMLVEASMDREDAENLQIFARQLITSAKDCMSLLSDRLTSKKNNEPDADDGI